MGGGEGGEGGDVGGGGSVVVEETALDYTPTYLAATTPPNTIPTVPPYS